MNDEVKGKRIDVEVIKLQSTMFVDWHKYNKYVTDNVSATVKKHGVDNKEVPYMIRVGRNPNDKLSIPALNKARAKLQKLASELLVKI